MRRPETLLLWMAAAVPLSFAVWQAQLNNFAIERISFTGAEIGILQSLREIPGFLAFTFVFVVIFVREQSFGLFSLALLGLGTAITGLFPSVMGLYATTVLMSIGFHYHETAQISLSLQWVDKAHAPRVLGRMIRVGSFAFVAACGLIFVTRALIGLDFSGVYAVAGFATLLIAAACTLAFPRFGGSVPQRKKLLLRRRYWLYYLLTFMSGARRQIFVVFAGFMMVERFGYDVEEITLLLLVNAAINMLFAERIGILIGRFGERRALIFEYVGLIGVFSAYAFVEHAMMAALLYVIDHAFFAITIAIRTYFQKIADPADLASSAGVAFTINHIAAVVIPVAFGFLWLVSPAAVFLSGAGIAAISLCLALLVPRDPRPGRETAWSSSTPLVVQSVADAS